MNIEIWTIDRVKEYARNPRKNAAAVDAVANSIREFGFRQPVVVDEDGVVIIGHTRLKAARQLGLTEVPVHVAAGLSPAKVKALRLADNRLHENSDWDKDLLSLEILDLRSLNFDLSLTGFEADELTDPDAADPRDVVVTNDRAAQLQAKWGTAEGQLWTMGPHRILCGSSTDPANWLRLMNGQTAALCNTDPPYGVSYSGGKKWEVIQGDKKRDDDLLSTLLVPALRLAVEHTEPDAAFYIWHASSTRRDFEAALDAVGLEEKQYIVWVKDGFVLGHADYHWQQEPAFYCQRSGTSCRWTGDRTQTTIWRIRPPAPADMALTLANGVRLSDGAGNGIYVAAQAPKARKTRLIRLGVGDSVAILPEGAGDAWQIGRDPAAERLHPTQKPVRLFMVPILNHTLPGDIVAEPFSGSGAQFLAAHATGRRCYGCDLDPKYVAVALERMTAEGVKCEQEKLS
jgi:site-specific DNA-methyltransferase (adenine-specific)